MNMSNKPMEPSEFSDLLDLFGASLHGLDEDRTRKARALIESNEAAQALYAQAQRLDDRLDTLQPKLNDMDRVHANVMAQIAHTPQAGQGTDAIQVERAKTSWLKQFISSFGLTEFSYGAGLAASIFVGAFLGSSVFTNEIGSILGDDGVPTATIAQEEMSLAFDDTVEDLWGISE